VKRGSLIRVHRGVYRLGHAAPSFDALCVAATKACGHGSGISGFAAAHLLSLQEAQPGVIEVTTPYDRTVPGLIVHRARRTVPELLRVRGIPVTSPAWTLLDIAPQIDDDLLGRYCHAAVVRHRLKPEAVARVAAKRGHPHGSSRLLRILSGDDPMLLSRLERAFLNILRDGRLQQPQTNRRMAEGYVDCRWPHLKLIVELDSYRFHGSRHAWERDRDRDRAARRRGEELLRYTPEDVFERGAEVLAEMAARLPAV